MPPDINKALTPYISGRKGKLHARKNVSVGRDVARRMPRAARCGFEIILSNFRRDRTEAFCVAHQLFVAENLPQGIVIDP
jgi:hypothetical protein